MCFEWCCRRRRLCKGRTDQIEISRSYTQGARTVQLGAARRDGEESSGNRNELGVSLLLLAPLVKRAGGGAGNGIEDSTVVSLERMERFVRHSPATRLSTKTDYAERNDTKEERTGFGWSIEKKDNGSASAARNRLSFSEGINLDLGLWRWHWWVQDKKPQCV